MTITRLTPRQRQVLQLAAGGAANAEIAAARALMWQEKSPA